MRWLSTTSHDQDLVMDKGFDDAMKNIWSPPSDRGYLKLYLAAWSDGRSTRYWDRFETITWN